MQSPPSVRLFPLYLLNRLTVVDLELLHVKVKIMVMGRAGAVSPTSIEDSFYAAS